MTMNNMVTRQAAGVLAVIVGLLLAGCGSDKGNNAVLEHYAATLTIEGVPGPGITHLEFPLTGEQVNPPVGNAGSGSVSIALSKASFAYTINLSGVFAVSRAELYLGAPGVNGSRAAILYSGSPGGIVNGPLIDSALVASDLEEVGMDEVQTAMLSGQAYVQIVTSSFPFGQLRGQTAPSGAAALTVGASSVLYSIDCYQLDSITSVTLNEGATGRTGILRVTLFEDTASTGTLSGEIVSDVFADAEVVDTTLVYLLDQIRAGNTYINVTTKDMPTGAIRGQVELVPEQ